MNHHPTVGAQTATLAIDPRDRDDTSALNDFANAWPKGIVAVAVRQKQGLAMAYLLGPADADRSDCGEELTPTDLFYLLETVAQARTSETAEATVGDR